MASRKSLFEQDLDRSVFVTYFLGAVVPLFGMAFFGERLLRVLPDGPARAGFLALIMAISALSLVSYLALRRIVHRAVANMTVQNDQLESLLHVARELATASHLQEVSEVACCWAGRLSQADASWVLIQRDEDKPFDVASQRGELASEWLEAGLDEWSEIVTRMDPSDGTSQIDGDESASPSVVLCPLTGDFDSTAFMVVARAERPFSPAEIDALSTLTAQTSVAFSNAERGDAQRNFFSHMTDLVLSALDTHISFRSGHASRVAESANLVGRAMGLEDSALHDLHFAALLHDVGMLKVPAGRQRDPKAFKTHSAVGFRILSRIRVWEKAAPIVLQHHERPDGQGYPDGLVQDDICLGARIIAVCDAWDAMRSQDSHRDAIAKEDAIAELKAHAGSQFDGDVVRAFEALVSEGHL